MDKSVNSTKMGGRADRAGFVLTMRWVAETFCEAERTLCEPQAQVLREVDHVIQLMTSVKLVDGPTPAAPSLQELVRGVEATFAMVAAEWTDRTKRLKLNATLNKDFGDPLLVLVYGLPNSGRRSLGDFVAYGRHDPDTTTIASLRDAEEAPSYFVRALEDDGDLDEANAKLKRIGKFAVAAEDAINAIQGFKLGGLTWVNAPWPGSVGGRNCELVRKYTESADLFLVLVDVNQVGRQLHERLIADLLGHGRGKPTVILLTRRDAIEAGDADGCIVGQLVVKPGDEAREAAESIEKQLARIRQRMGADPMLPEVQSESVVYAGKDPCESALELGGLESLYSRITKMAADEGVALKREAPALSLKAFIDAILGSGGGVRRIRDQLGALRYGVDSEIIRLDVRGRDAKEEAKQEIVTIVQSAARQAKEWRPNETPLASGAGVVVGIPPGGVDPQTRLQHELAERTRDIIFRHLQQIVRETIGDAGTTVTKSIELDVPEVNPMFETMKSTAGYAALHVPISLWSVMSPAPMFETMKSTAGYAALHVPISLWSVMSPAAASEEHEIRYSESEAIDEIAAALTQEAKKIIGQCVDDVRNGYLLPIGQRADVVTDGLRQFEESLRTIFQSLSGHVMHFMSSGQVIQAMNDRQTVRTLQGQSHPSKRMGSSTPSPMSLPIAVKACRKAACRGYRNAEQHLGEVAAAINQTVQQLETKRGDHAQLRVQTSDVDRELQAQMDEVIAELHDLQTEFRTSLEARGKNLDEFSIALFGRTMAGKSTLMEILTNGDGTSIGTGAQRTTRDVRSYRWKGLKVTDVPGVAAFEGLEDEELAFEAADNADLVLFIITDDAPQPAEAECLARVRSLGKPVLGICNVKVAIDEDDEPKLFRRLVEKAFEPERLGGIVNQFHGFADQFTPGDRIQFVWTHLRSRYLSQRQANPLRRRTLAEVSRFARVEQEIVSVVVNQGTFLRVKSFIDASVVAMLKLSDCLLEFSAQNADSGGVLRGKKRQTLAWREDFRRSGKSCIDAGVSDTVEDLRKLIPSFADENYDRENAGKRWSKEVERCGVEKAAERIQKSLFSECQDQMGQIARELQAELRLAGDFAGDRKISMDPIFDGKRAWRWGTALVGGGLGVAALFVVSGPLGWAAVAVGAIGWLGSLLFEDREEKASRQRKKLEKKLRKNVDAIESQMREGLHQWFDKELLLGQVDVLIDDLSVVVDNLFELANTQRALAWILNRKLKALHQELLREALDQLGCKGAVEGVRDVARIPGAVMLVLEPGTTVPDDVRCRLQRLLRESVWFVVDTGSRFSMLCQAIGIRQSHERRRVSVEEQIQVAHVPVGVLDATRRARIRLAQQLTELHVMK